MPRKKVEKKVEAPKEVEVEVAPEPKKGKWLPSLGEKFELNGEIAEVLSFDPLKVIVHEIVGGCQTTREIDASLDGAVELDKDEAFRRLA